MKFKVGDQVLVTAGKDKGLKSEIVFVLPDKNEVVVRGANYYVKHVKPVPMLNRPGERIRKERPLSVGKIAILNEKGQIDRIGYKIGDDGKKTRIYKKTGTVIEEKKKDKKASAKSKTASKKDDSKSAKSSKAKTKKTKKLESQNK